LVFSFPSRRNKWDECDIGNANEPAMDAMDAMDAMITKN